MKFKSALMTQVSGSVGGATFARNQGGLYIRARSVPTNPTTSFQVAVRNALATLTNRWTQTLTVAQRNGWDTYARQVPLTGPLGDARPIGALAMYVRCNVPRLQSGTPVQDSFPTVFTLGTFTLGAVTASAIGQNLSVGFTNTDLWAPAVGGALLLYVSRPQSIGINFFKGPYRYAGRIAGAVVPPVSPQTITSPFAFTVGQKIFFYAQATFPDGRLTAPIRRDTVAAV